MIVILIRSKAFGAVVFGTFDSQDEATKAIVAYRDMAGEGYWTDRIAFEAYEGETARHMLEVWGDKD